MRNGLAASRFPECHAPAQSHPVGRCEVDDPVLGPAGQEAEEIARICQRPKPVRGAAREQRDEGLFTVAASSVPIKSQLRRPMT